MMSGLISLAPHCSQGSPPSWSRPRSPLSRHVCISSTSWLSVAVVHPSVHGICSPARQWDGLGLPIVLIVPDVMASANTVGICCVANDPLFHRPAACMSLLSSDLISFQSPGLF